MYKIPPVVHIRQITNTEYSVNFPYSNTVVLRVKICHLRIQRKRPDMALVYYTRIYCRLHAKITRIYSIRNISIP